jgi:hypothetical protein
MHSQEYASPPPVLELDGRPNGRPGVARKPVSEPDSERRAAGTGHTEPHRGSALSAQPLRDASPLQFAVSTARRPPSCCSSLTHRMQ